jgi:hypothetical protein
MKTIRLLGLGALLLFAGCKGSTTPIQTLLDDPAQYDRKIVTVAGTVGRSIGVLGYGAYELSDDTGKISIVSRTGGAPREGAEVVVRGEFRNAFTLGATTGAAILEQDRASKP